jgi:hypothetical protein
MLSELEKATQGKSKAKVSNKVKDYGNDPFFVKKAKESREFLQKHGFPQEIVIKK